MRSRPGMETKRSCRPRCWPCGAKSKFSKGRSSGCTGVPARFLLHDHDAKYGGGSDRVFAGDGVSVIRTPIAAPRANSHMERQIDSTRRQCLDWILILNRRHLERVLTEWIELYNQARPHRGLDLQTPIARSDPVVTSGPVRCRERLGGLLREYSSTPMSTAA